MSVEVPRWDVFERELRGPSGGNPFTEVAVSAEFRHRNRVLRVRGFYTGDGIYRIRFSPDQVGHWRYRVRSNAAELDGAIGTFICGPPGAGNHGPVEVDGRAGFRYADGLRFYPFGTTCYHWTHQMDEAAEQRTLESLADSPYNKVRMCVLPTNAMRPPRIAFPEVAPGQLDKTRFDPEFFEHLERRIRDLRDLGIEADVILFHPYDRGFWGVDTMTQDEEERYLDYVVARLGGYRNVWWSLSNEFDFNKAKTTGDWDRMLRLVQRIDPYQRLRSIHNGTRMYEYCEPYDFSTPWTTHQCIQHWDTDQVPAWLSEVGKPVIIDEIGYEGEIERRWGNLTGQELVDRVWLGVTRGGYVSHGECFHERPFGPWISVGGELYGESSSRIAFLRDLLENRDETTTSFRYFGNRTPTYTELDLEPERSYRVEYIDVWEMTIGETSGPVRGDARIALPGRPYTALRITEVA